MRIAVSGASGFVGSHVVAALAQRGVDVVRFARRAPGAEDRELDVLDPPGDAFERLGRPRVLVHLAWGGLPRYHAVDHFERELPGHYRFLKLMLKSGVEHLVVAGTCLEYGLRSGKLEERHKPDPTTSYGFAKDALRRQLELLQRDIPFTLTWTRLFYLFGEGQSENALWSQLQRALARGDSSFDMSGGEQLRDYLPVTEAARLLAILATRCMNDGIVNVCSGRPVSVRTKVEEWVREAERTIALNLGRYPYPDYEPLAFWGSREKLDRCMTDASREPQAE
ncbi:MAG: NAD-dependent epimerase/dehydratase family protein [Thermoanaerobaculia bacterium]